MRKDASSFFHGAFQVMVWLITIAVLVAAVHLALLLPAQLPFPFFKP